MCRARKWVAVIAGVILLGGCRSAPQGGSGGSSGPEARPGGATTHAAVSATKVQPIAAALLEDEEKAARSAARAFGAADLADEHVPRDPILARVGDEEVRASDLYLPLRIEWPARVDAALRDRVREIFIRREAALHDVTIGEAEVEGRLRDVLEDQARRVSEALEGRVAFEDFVRGQYGMEPEDFRRVVRRKVVASLLLERLVRYQALLEDRYELAVILVRTRVEAEELQQKLLEGASFEVLAREHSTHATAASGGRLPPLPATFKSPLTDGALALRPGEVSPVIPVSFGEETLFKILRLLEVLPASSGSFKELEAEIEAGLAARPVDGLELPAWEQRMAERYAVGLGDAFSRAVRGGAP
ncbi:MAG: peptidylprolyl isomerase [Planctomycetota bacterium]